MIEQLNPHDYYSLVEIVDYITEKVDYDFYYTVDNTRIYVSDVRTLKQLLKETSVGYVAKNKGNIQGILLVWRSEGAGTKRNYVKVCANSSNDVRDLLMMLIWHSHRDLYVKIKKNSPFIGSFKSKNFKFIGCRGSQILLERKHVPLEIKVFQKEEDLYDNK